MVSPTPTTSQGTAHNLNRSLQDSNNPAIVAVIGVGYVGKHLVDIFSSTFKTIGYDVSPSRIETLRLEYPRSDYLKFSNDEKDLEDASHFLICVPTTLGLNGEVDPSHVRNAIDMLGRHVSDKSIVVIESTVAVGMTRKLLGPLAKSRGIFAGMSPEVRTLLKTNRTMIYLHTQLEN
jgi:UDP-N-acetyl-D-mannosaminuronate dehydrogenase